MDLAERRRQIAIDSDHERHARDAGHRAAHAAGVARRDQNGRQHSQKAHTQRHGAHGDRVKDAALRIEIGSGHQRENGERARNVHERDERAGAEDSARQRAARIVHFLAHGGNQFEAGESKGDLRPEIDRIPVPRGHHVGQGEMRGGAVAQARPAQPRPPASAAAHTFPRRPRSAATCRC